jgi:hypothetical protein
MRNTLPWIAPFLLFTYALAQAPNEKNQKAADSPSNPVKAKSLDKPSDKSVDKPGSGGLKLGVPTDSEKLLDQAIAKVESIKKFRTDVRQKTDMLGYTFTAEGQYAMAPDFHLLYELKVQLTNDTTGSIKEVCDGRTHWRNQKVLDTQELVKMDVKKLREVFEKPQFNKDIRDQLVRQLGFSGMVPIMKGLRESQTFQSHEEETMDGHPVYVLHGQWREEVISQSAFRGEQLSLAKLPTRFPYVPSKSTIWIGREDGWLHKLELEGSKKMQGSVTKITFEFLNPQVEVDLPDAMFAYEPPAGVHVEDQTDLMYQRLGVILQQSQNTEKRPADAAAPTPATDSTKKATPATGQPPAKVGIGAPP